MHLTTNDRLFLIRMWEHGITEPWPLSPRNSFSSVAFLQTNPPRAGPRPREPWNRRNNESHRHRTFRSGYSCTSPPAEPEPRVLLQVSDRRGEALRSNHPVGVTVPRGERWRIGSEAKESSELREQKRGMFEQCPLPVVFSSPLWPGIRWSPQRKLNGHPSALQPRLLGRWEE